MRVSIATFHPKATRGFIAIEGVNGAGKGTLLAGLSFRLEAERHEVVVTREPGGTPLGLALRKILLESPPGVLSPEAELFLFAADRSHHIDTVIERSLRRGALVLTDR